MFYYPHYCLKNYAIILLSIDQKFICLMVAGKGKRYAARTIQHIMQTALAKAGLSNKNYSIHSIRHSFATHLLDHGADLQAIQQLMGHNSINQTVQYLHLSTKRLQSIVNPYDVIMQKSTNEKC
ncbi:tyrosine-type recombinase/integrase [Sediminibacterium sp. C3]|uniref:tyrosine-type recombinase/integrase n=1 Tax=Sediminibacterium sp. C3 TaxID=1267211 RepID=UPI0009E03372